MSQTCAHCARINPLEALYCYYDGSALNGAHTASQDVGAQPSRSEEVVSTALGGDWEFRGIRPPRRD